MDAVWRYLRPPVAAAVIGLLVAAQLAAVLSFSLSYAARGRRIAELEAALCRERLARFAPLTSDAPCPDAQKILAEALPQVWVPVAGTRSGARFGAGVTRWRAAYASAASR